MPTMTPVLPSKVRTPNTALKPSTSLYPSAANKPIPATSSTGTMVPA